MVVGAIKTLILGANGMLGFDLCKAFPDAIKLTHRELDITNRDQVLESILRINPKLVINAAAYTDVEGCEDQQELAFQVNGYGPGYIAEACNKIGAILVHFSTDYVFDGSKKEYVESDAPNPINIYGHSKLLGEKKIIESMDDYRIIRISWLFGTHGRNFVETMLKLSGEIAEVKVVNDQFGKPTYTVDLAHKISELVELDPGIYHITNDGICSWYEFASSFIRNAVPCTSEEFPRKAKRPKYSVLVNTKIEPMRHWKEALKAYLKERNI
ncbi:TPA: dTDP-4-dehydrorhamnose reductase [Methanosarcina acetivorans]|uniref:dTDP-4-dehydrorhamnose reductase n=2 Tax=Methanosarcina acetivorans TaxID=2214 RepID=Q8TJK6_METAC|nr:dTDP-4-dehydrorhamnose reductase [Methanosarcina acetivorans]AAM07129.1 dTDP-4-dehydrorhamnose reductase [Methanosarcina acetivorans C2A]HIH92820.1 dTDP-4-dehydrorhamnose reductase [Methanosarcina acetivorans]